MSDYYDGFRVQAKMKLDEGVREKLDWYGEVMKKAVHDALLGFCEQNGEFAQAVAQGGAFKDCMKAVAKCVKGSALSDMEAYGAAVRFYFPGADIKVSMSIDLCASVNGAAQDVAVPEAPKREVSPDSSRVLIDLSSFF